MSFFITCSKTRKKRRRSRAPRVYLLAQCAPRRATLLLHSSGFAPEAVDLAESQPGVGVAVARPAFEDEPDVAMPGDGQVGVRRPTAEDIAQRLPSQPAVGGGVDREVAPPATVGRVAEVEDALARHGGDRPLAVGRGQAELQVVDVRPDLRPVRAACAPRDAKSGHQSDGEAQLQGDLVSKQGWCPSKAGWFGTSKGWLVSKSGTTHRRRSGRTSGRAGRSWC
jgi:hypothetical protein